MRRTPKREADVDRAGAAFVAVTTALADCGVEQKVIVETMRAVATTLAAAMSEGAVRVTDKVIFLHADRINAAALLQKVMEREGLEAVVMSIRIDGEWQTTWGGDLNTGSLALAAVKLFRDVSNATEKDSE